MKFIFGVQVSFRFTRLGEAASGAARRSS